MTVATNNKIFLGVVFFSLITAFFDASLIAYGSECEGYDVDEAYSECDAMYCGEYECDDQEEQQDDEEGEGESDE